MFRNFHEKKKPTKCSMITFKLKCLNLAFPGDHRPEGTFPLTSQTAGKRTFLQTTNGIIFKPYPRRQPLAEAEFYRWVNDESREQHKPDIKDFVPKYFGCIVNDHFTFVMLENVTFTMKNPSIIDIKIGSKTWTPGDCKLKKLQEKICHPAAKDVGFRITGGKSFNVVTNSYKAIKFWDIRSYSKTELVDKVFTPFFSDEIGKLREKLVTKILDKLRDILLWFYRFNKMFHLRSSSILIAFDPSVKDEDCIRFEVRMIDFAHVVPSSQFGYLTDLNYIIGLRNLIECLESLFDSKSN